MQNSQLVDGLKQILDATHLLYLKTHAAHWNVTGPLFPQLHELFGGQYADLHGATDELAERLRQMQVPAVFPAAMPEGGVSDPAELAASLKAQNEALSVLCRNVSKCADAEGDQGTIDLLGRRMGAHDKAAWMLRSVLETPAPEATATSWVPMSMSFGEWMWSHGITKSASHEVLADGSQLMALPEIMAKAVTGQPKPGAKYIKRTPTGNAKRPWKYFYAVQHGGGVANKEHFVEGASFKHGDGHFHIHGVKDGKLIVSHGDGEKKHMTHDELASKLTDFHGKAIAAHKEKLLGEIEDARKAGNAKGVERLSAEAKKAGYAVNSGADPVKEVHDRLARVKEQSKARGYSFNLLSPLKPGSSDKDVKDFHRDIDQHEKWMDTMDAGKTAAKAREAAKNAPKKTKDESLAAANAVRSKAAADKNEEHMNKTAIRHKGELLSRKEFSDRAIAEGHTEVVKHPKEGWIARNPTDGSHYKVDKATADHISTKLDAKRQKDEAAKKPAEHAEKTKNDLKPEELQPEDRYSGSDVRGRFQDMVERAKDKGLHVKESKHAIHVSDAPLGEHRAAITLGKDNERVSFLPSPREHWDSPQEEARGQAANAKVKEHWDAFKHDVSRAGYDERQTKHKAMRAETEAKEKVARAAKAEVKPKTDPNIIDGMDFSGGASVGKTAKEAPAKTEKKAEPVPEIKVPTEKVEHSIANSGNLERTSWTPNKEGEAAGTMRVHFKGGGAYDYKDVPHSHYHATVNAGSPGEAFNDRVKGKYESTKIRSAANETGHRQDGPVRTSKTELNEQAVARKEKSAEKQKQAHDFIKERDESRAKAAEPKSAEPDKTEATKPTHADLVSQAKETYKLSDAEADKVHARSLKSGADKHVAAGNHEEAAAAVKQAVKDHLVLSQDRGLSPSKAKGYMDKMDLLANKRRIQKSGNAFLLAITAMRK